MRFVSVKGEEKQALAVVFRARDMLVGQRTQLINDLRGHMAEYGVIAPQGPAHVERLIAQIEDPASSLPQSARTCLQVLVDRTRSAGRPRAPNRGRDLPKVTRSAAARPARMVVAIDLWLVLRRDSGDRSAERRIKLDGCDKVVRPLRHVRRAHDEAGVHERDVRYELGRGRQGRGDELEVRAGVGVWPWGLSAAANWSGAPSTTDFQRTRSLGCFLARPCEGLMREAERPVGSAQLIGVGPCTSATPPSWRSS